ncbi:[Pyruvate dehydrogenase (acetyl-transferring)] kinase, mitochondrial [Pichia kudriavzevii]|uniref:Protein-serine/threonine kinase n=1 Tax=Pichia kudriavzevii TaxID=4909 RepID=A0A1V2LNG7_PICKU|nr:[Pyruvate dehydrogenase (acetyl-transferring)] kinase, mitochondrial [Pichia kudriavzevii]
MLKAFTSLFKNSGGKVTPKIVLTPEILSSREGVTNKLKDLYSTQIKLLSSKRDAKIPVVNHYVELLEQYEKQNEELHKLNPLDEGLSQESFIELLDNQLSVKVEELAKINSKLSFEDLSNLNAILSLNDYPVPTFEIDSIPLKVKCVAPHLIHIMFELFKNSTLPSISRKKPIIVRVTDEDGFVMFEIADRGGGMPDSSLDKIWQFHYTTSKISERDPIHGFGMGLPLCKVFADFNSGKLSMVNHEHFGVSVFLKIPRAFKD